ncbi:MAG: hypothetical protein R3A52_02005 [Polyangiales bacterium]
MSGAQAERRVIGERCVIVYRTGAAPTRVVVYVHGFLPGGRLEGFATSVDRAWAKNFLREQFDASGVEATFVVIEAKKSSADRVKWPRLDALLDALGLDAPVAAMGHSGAYSTLVGWLSDPRLKHVTLLDALYGDVSAYREFAASPGRTMTLVATGGATLKNSRALLARLPAAQRSAWVQERVDVPSSMTNDALAAKVLFIESRSLDHTALVLSQRAIPALVRRAAFAPP